MTTQNEELKLKYCGTCGTQLQENATTCMVCGSELLQKGTSPFLLRAQYDHNAQHVFHHSDISNPTITLKAIKNTKGYNWEVGVHGAWSVDQAMSLMKDAESQMNAIYGEPKDEKEE